MNEMYIYLLIKSYCENFKKKSFLFHVFDLLRNKTITMTTSLPSFCSFLFLFIFVSFITQDFRLFTTSPSFDARNIVPLIVRLFKTSIERRRHYVNNNSR